MSGEQHGRRPTIRSSARNVSRRRFLRWSGGAGIGFVTGAGLLAACSESESTVSDVPSESTAPGDPPESTMSDRSVDSETTTSDDPDGGVVFPGATWETATPAEMGLRSPAWEQWLTEQDPRATTALGEDPSLPWGAALTRAGRLVHTWGQPDVPRQSASVGKAFTKMALVLTVQQGLIGNVTDPVAAYWTGAGELDGPHKHLDNERHGAVTFEALVRHRAGFPVTNGADWQDQKGVPGWADWTGDPGFDNYAHAIEPGEHYSSGGYWRASQALTAIHGRTLKTVLDEALMGPMGIPPERWEWLPGRTVHEDADFYPAALEYGAFIDPPYEIDGVPVLGGGGWVVMSPLDLARVGLLVATRGWWDGRRLIADDPLVDGHAGGNDSLLWGRGGELMASFAQVGTAGLGPPPDDVFGPFPR